MEQTAPQPPPDLNPFHNSWKMLHHLDRLAEWKQTGSTRPVMMEVNLTNICNQACRWCISSYSHISNPAMSAAEKQEKKEAASGCVSKGIDFAHLCRFIEEARDFGMKAVTWSGGGEPTVHPGFAEIATFTSGKLEQGLMTNGQFHPRLVPVIGEKIKWARISLDTFDPERYRYQRYSSQFESVIRNVRALTKYPVNVGLNMNIAAWNMDEIEAFARKGRELGVDYVQFRPVLALPFEMRHDSPYRNQLGQSLLPSIKEAMRKAITYATDRFKVLISWDKFNDIEDEATDFGRTYQRCEGHHFMFVVDANGDLDVCMYHLGEREFKMGNIYENTLSEIWGNAQRAAVVRHCSDGIDFSKCQSCCKLHNLNKFLHSLKSEVEYANFL
jgi:radical SAM protein with 4Fe4S-binding SPASM domain